MKRGSNPSEGGICLREALTIAAWFGLVTGLVEGIALLVFQQRGWLNFDMAQEPVWYEILWISPAFDLLLFGAWGLIVAAVAQRLPDGLALRFAAFAFAFPMFLDWATLSGRLRNSAALVLSLGMATVVVRQMERRETALRRFWRRSLPWAAVVVVLLFVGIEGISLLEERLAFARLPHAPAEMPNVLLIVVDTLRADHLSAYGYARATSPHFDRIAQQGVLFERAFSTSSWTLPSHASILTGRYPHEHGAVKDRYDGRFRGIAEELLHRGYQTGAFSANFLFFSRPSGFGRGFIRFEDFFQTPVDMASRTVFGKKFQMHVLFRLGYRKIIGRRRAGDINSALLRWLDRKSDAPFFAFLNYYDSHDPYRPPQPYLSRFSKVPNPGGHINSSTQVLSGKLSPDQVREEIDAYDGAVAYVDDQIDNLMAELKKRGLLENTIVVITSDHGELFGEHNLYRHRYALYRNLIHVPLVVFAPGRVPAGVRVSTPVSNMALPGTLLELLGANPNSEFRGPSLVPLWSTSAAHLDYPFPLAELTQTRIQGLQDAPSYYGAMQSLVSPEWQYIRNEKLGTELFDWNKDPQELKNLAKAPETQTVMSEFAARLQEMLKPATPTAQKTARRAVR